MNLRVDWVSQEVTDFQEGQGEGSGYYSSVEARTKEEYLDLLSIMHRTPAQSSGLQDLAMCPDFFKCIVEREEGFTKINLLSTIISSPYISHNPEDTYYFYGTRTALWTRGRCISSASHWTEGYTTVDSLLGILAPAPRSRLTRHVPRYRTRRRGPAASYIFMDLRLSFDNRKYMIIAMVKKSVCLVIIAWCAQSEKIRR